MSQPLRNEELLYQYHQEQTEPQTSLQTWTGPRKRVRARKTFNISRSRLPVFILSLLLVYLIMSFCSQFSKLTSMQRDVRDIQLQVQEMQQKNAAMREELRLAQSDAYIEKTAREKIGLVKPGETRIVTVVPGDASVPIEVPTEQNIVAD